MGESYIRKDSQVRATYRIRVEFKGSHPVSLRIPCSLPGMEVLLPLFLNRKPEEDVEQLEENDEV